MEPTARPPRARALGHLVHHLFELLVLRLEELVRLAEVGPLDVPVVVACLEVEQDLVGQQAIEDVPIESLNRGGRNFP
jgi:hypothetical protein